MQERPSVFSYSDAVAFVGDMLAWKKLHDPQFSLRSATAGLHRCSPTLVTLVLQRKRKLTPDRAKDFAKVLELSPRERAYFEAKVLGAATPEEKSDEKPFSNRQATMRRSVTRPRASNHILSDWLHPYVKDAARLSGFVPEAQTLFRLLRGISTPQRLSRSLDFLLREGYLRRTLDGKIVENEVLDETTDEIPSKQIRGFHKKALQIAADAIETCPMGEREANTILLPLNRERFLKLKSLIKEWAEETAALAEAYPQDNERLYQLIINLSPVAGDDLSPVHKEPTQCS